MINYRNYFIVLKIMSIASTRKLPKSFRENPNSAYGIGKGDVQKTIRKANKRGSSFINSKKENSSSDVNTYASTAKSKSSSKAMFSSKVYGSSSLVRPKRMMYSGVGESELAPMNHDVAKQKLETLFSSKVASKRDPLQLLTKPRKKLNMLKRLPNDQKYTPVNRISRAGVVINRESVKLNKAGQKQMTASSDSGFSNKTGGRVTTAQTENTSSRTGTRQGRTRAQIVAEFYCSQNWNYFVQKAIMLKKERREAKKCIFKYRRFKLGMKRFWRVYKVWIAKVKQQRAMQQQILAEEEKHNFDQEQMKSTHDEDQQNFEEEEKQQEKVQSDMIQQIEEVKK
jgi:hypothetical protein